jgi:dTDP-4-amino-4,6-dideoxygalactose transaminase
LSDRAARLTFLPFSRPALGEEEVRAVVDCLRSGWITTGPRTREFEEKFAAYAGARHALAVTSGTAGEHLALLALGIGPGDEVVTSPMTWTSTVNIVELVGARPVFADIEPDTHNLDPAKLRGALTERTRAIIPVHFAGLPCDMDAIGAIASERGIPVIEDAAHAAGAAYRERPVGSLSRLTVFSFHAIKNLTTGEGGMITTDDDALADRIRLLRFHGITRDSWQRQGAGAGAAYDVLVPGFKYNLTDIQSAIGVVQLARLDALNERRESLARRYLDALAGVEEIRLPAAGAGYPVRHAWHLFTILVDVDRLTVDRFGFMEAMKRENIGTGLHFLAVHLQSHYRTRYGYAPGDFPEAERVSERIVSLPLFPGMIEADVDAVARAVKKVVRAHRR